MVDLSKKYDHYSRRLRQAMQARNLTNEEMASRTESHPVTISKLRTGRITLDDEWRARMAQGLGMPEEVLFGEGPLPAPSARELFRPLKRRGRKPVNDNSELPVYGLAAGSLQGHYVMTTEVIETVPCPPGLKDVFGAYALRTHGDSMVPRYFPRDILYVNPNQPIVAGDHVVVQVRHAEGAGTETWVKRYDGQNDADVMVSQYNPPGRIVFRRQYVQHLHRVLPVNELYPTR